MADLSADASVGGKPVYTPRYRSLVLTLLVVAYTLNFVDRTIISTIGQAIKVDLKITDTQLGLLGGLYFALLYTLLGIPIARLAERFSRVNIISAAILIWSGFTALCGTAGSFVTLAAYRFGVGFGEAGLSPPAHSLLSDYFEPKKRASALAIYAFGIPMGSMFGAVVGGYLAQNFSWRVAFMLVGLPGVVIAIAIKLLIKEPARGHSELDQGEAAIAARAPQKATMAGEFKELWEVAKILFTKWPVANMVLGLTLASFAGYGWGQFVPPLFARAYGDPAGHASWTWLQFLAAPSGDYKLDLAKIGLITGLVGGISSGIGTILGGVITDAMAKRSPRWYALTPAIGLTIATPIYIFAYMQQTWQATALLLLIPGIFHYTYLGPSFGVVQNMVETRRRATAAAVMLFFVNLIALGGGPPFTGWIIDHFAQFNFTHGGDHGAWASVQALFSGNTGGHEFVQACPGGNAPKGSPVELAAQCHTSLVSATRSGVIVSICFLLWAAFHYLLGSFGLVKALAKARADRGEAD